MVMELCPLDLDKVIKSNLLLGDKDIKAYLKMTIHGLIALHDRFIMHRDIKPGNLLIGMDRQIKVADFGLAKVFGNPDPKDTDTVVTLPYRCPELLFGAQKYSTAVDMWALGCVFAEMMIRDIFLPGKDETDQLGKIFFTFGTPTSETWPNHEHLSKFVYFTNCRAPSLKKRFPAAPDEALEFLKDLMRLNPCDRITAHEALNHEYFHKGSVPTDPSLLPFDELLQKKK